MHGSNLGLNYHKFKKRRMLMKKILITVLLSCLTLQSLYATRMRVINNTAIPLKIDYKTNQSLGKFLAAVPSKLQKVGPGKRKTGLWVGSTLEAFKINGKEVKVPDKHKKENNWILEVNPSTKKLGAFEYILCKHHSDWIPRTGFASPSLGVKLTVAAGAKAGLDPVVVTFYYKGKPRKKQYECIFVNRNTIYTNPFAEALGKAIQKNQPALWQKVNELIKKKDTDVNIQFPDGDRPLHKIVELAPKIDIVKALLERKEGNKADVNARGKNGRSVLMIAASKYPHDKLMDYLLAKGADRKARDKFGSNVLHYIVTSQDLSFADSVANINKLLSIKWSKIDQNLMKMIDEKNKSKRSPLEVARMQYTFSKSARQVKAAERYRKLIKYLEDIKKKPKEAARRRQYQRWYDKPEDTKKKPKAGLSEKDKAALRQRWYGK